MKIAEYIQKLQSLPEGQKKAILWVTVGIIVVIFFAFWFNSAKKSLEQMNLNNAFTPVSSSLKDASLTSPGKIEGQVQGVLDRLNPQNQASGTK